MSFQNSCVTKLAPYQVQEQCAGLPEKIFPVYIGSGSMILSVDASGMQCLNHGVQENFKSMPHAGDLYLVRNGRTGDQIDPMNVLPYGYLTWSMHLNDLDVTPETLREQANLFCRELDLEQGMVRTDLLLGRQVDLSWELCMPLHTNCLMMRLYLKENCYAAVHEHREHTGAMEVRLHMQSRAGTPLYTAAELCGPLLRLEAEGTEHYCDEIRMEGTMPLAVRLEHDDLVLTFDVSVRKEEQVYTLLLDFDHQHGAADADALLAENAAARCREFEALAEIEGLDVEELYLYHNTQYLLMSCYQFEMGLPIGMPFYFPWCWKTGTFWDSHFVMDGLMRTGGRKQADAFLQFLHRVMRTEGKPFPWMFDYAGRPCVPDSEDVAPLCMCAHAMTAIKHYEYFGDRQMLQAHILPILECVSRYAVRELYTKEDGVWIMSRAVSNDVVDRNLVEVNQTFTTLWFLVVLAKTVEYQKLLGKRPDETMEEIVSNHWLEKDEFEYYHSKNTRVSDHTGGSWVPFLCYPSEGMPFLDLELFNQTRAKYSFVTEYMTKQSSYQPWTEFMEAMSDFRRGAPEAGFALRRRGLSHAFGVGYFSEIGPCMETCGLPPYISAHGTFLTSLIDQFILTSVWEHSVKIFANMPQYYWGRNLRLQNVVCSGARILEARINAYETVVQLRAESVPGTLHLEIKVPNAAGVCPDVRVNGQKVEFHFHEETRTVELEAALSPVRRTTIRVS